MDKFMIDRGYNVVDDVKRAGLTTVYLDLSTDPLSGPQQSLRVLGKAVGEEKRAEQIASFIDSRINPVLERVSRISADKRPSVYIEAGHVGASSYGPTYGEHFKGGLSSWGRVIEAAGGDNIARGCVSGMASIRPEALLASDPTFILITGAHWRGVDDSMRLGGKTDRNLAQERLAAFTQRKGWSELTAVSSGNVYGIYHGWCIHATAFAALEYCVKWLHPDLFEGIDPDGGLREFHQRFSPIPNEGCFVVKSAPVEGK